MKTYIFSYLATFVAFLAIDLVWLGVVAKSTYDKFLANFLAEQVNWPIAFTFYLLYVVGIFIFAVAPAAEKNSATQALVGGALFGFFAYMTYELTNFAVIDKWPWQIVVIDIAWGVFLTAAVSSIGYYFYNLFLN